MKDSTATSSSNVKLQQYITLALDDPLPCLRSIHGGDPYATTWVKKFRVLTLGIDNSWKVIENNVIPHAPFGHALCMSGVLYYQAYTGKKMKDLAIMSFDVRSEKLYPIKGPSTLLCHTSSNLLSYEGKLAVVFYEKNVVRLCVLEDSAKEEWLTKTFGLSIEVSPINWLKNRDKRLATETDTGEIILAPRIMHESRADLVYYDMKTRSEKTVYIRGNGTRGNTGSLKLYHVAFRVQSVSSNLVENLMFL
ncbi:unnamed protein product [Eruca vesicaria subsp. sativa]|uniref:F-box associated beta-propeller type 3 domain-containing protein n=1 Tax=Eruca vesicaria subsp. sativa TaxID=29727 RepID=A0ABC8LDI9_ERUVS|nr:unnamed protein product [Eruca vesicaria subsp. sativa]